MARRIQHRSLGVQAFRTPTPNHGAMSGWYRTMLEGGNSDRIARSMHPEWTTVGCPFYPWEYEDLAPKRVETWESQIQKVWHPQHWLTYDIEAYTPRWISKLEDVGEAIGEKRLQEEYCPCYWCSGANPSRSDLMTRLERLVECSGRPSIPLYFVAVTDDSYRKWHVSMPVLWVRYRFLKTFDTGLDLINIYRTMGKNITRIYDIPEFPYPNDYPIALL